MFRFGIKAVGAVMIICSIVYLFGLAGSDTIGMAPVSNLSLLGQVIGGLLGAVVGFLLLGGEVTCTK